MSLSRLARFAPNIEESDRNEQAVRKVELALLFRLLPGKPKGFEAHRLILGRLLGRIVFRFHGLPDACLFLLLNSLCLSTIPGAAVIARHGALASCS